MIVLWLVLFSRKQGLKFVGYSFTLSGVLSIIGWFLLNSDSQPELISFNQITRDKCDMKLNNLDHFLYIQQILSIP